MANGTANRTEKACKRHETCLTYNHIRIELIDEALRKFPPIDVATLPHIIPPTGDI